MHTLIYEHSELGGDSIDWTSQQMRLLRADDIIDLERDCSLELLEMFKPLNLSEFPPSNYGSDTPGERMDKEGTWSILGSQ